MQWCAMQAEIFTYVNLDQLVPYDREKGRLAKVEAPQIAA